MRESEGQRKRKREGEKVWKIKRYREISRMKKRERGNT